MISLRPDLINQIDPNNDDENNHLPELIINNFDKFDKKEIVNYIKKIDYDTLLNIYYIIESDYSGHKNFKDFVKCVIDINLKFFKYYKKEKKGKDEDYKEILTYYNEKFDLKNK
jgi:hypothetical protein